MTTDNKTLADECNCPNGRAEHMPTCASLRATLADVKPGGMVRLQQAIPPEGYAGAWIRSAYGQPSSFTYWNMEVAYAAGWQAALSAQSSPSGQDALLGYVRVEAIKALREDDEVTGVMVHVEERTNSLPVYLAARQPVYVQGCDELRARTEGERAAYREGLEEGKKIAARQLVASNQPSGNSGELDVDGARQPVGQIVGYMDPNADFMLARPGDCVLMGNIVLWREPGSKYTKPLYDAPPAQAVDLSTLERFECQLYENPWPHSKMDEVDGGDWVRFDDVKALIDSRTVQTAQAVDLAALKALYHAYVRLLESGRDRIIDLGGTCDPVDVMEANDVDLQAARRVIDGQAVGNGN